MGTRYIFITGGVVSSLGKGITSASLGALLQARGFRIKLKKIDPYLNVDPGTISPFDHGEVFVTKDGKETDLDLGHYERFTDLNLEATDSITSGIIYEEIIKRERRGDYLGKTVQVIPHVTELVKEVIKFKTAEIDFVICEIGGTVGDLEAIQYYEVIRQMKSELGPQNVLVLQLTLLPYIATSQELKTKPTQQSVRQLSALGVHSDIIVCRADRPIPKELLVKISRFTGIPKSSVIPLPDQKEIYQVPLVLHAAKLDERILSLAGLSATKEADLSSWHNVVDKITQSQTSVTIGLIGKYNELQDSYSSLIEALRHGGIDNSTRVQIKWINADVNDEKELEKNLEDVDGIVIPGGFGMRGVEGKIAAVEYARTHQVPFLGICYGMQLAAVSLARHVLGIEGAQTTEVSKTGPPIIGLLTEWKNEEEVEQRDEEANYGGTMRLGNYTCALKKDSLAYKIYQRDTIVERHRHRYEFNDHYRDAFLAAGIEISGTSVGEELVEIIELPNHPWFMGVQFHPEFISRPFRPHPLFCSFIAAANKTQKDKTS